jgi:hypothetical protein
MQECSNNRQNPEHKRIAIFGQSLILPRIIAKDPVPEILEGGGGQLESINVPYIILCYSNS